MQLFKCISEISVDLSNLDASEKNSRSQRFQRSQWCRSGVFIVNIEHISHIVLLFLLLNLNMFYFFAIR